jgi:hypothetical protein
MSDNQSGGPSQENLKAMFEEVMSDNQSGGPSLENFKAMFEHGLGLHMAGLRHLAEQQSSAEGGDDVATDMAASA